MRSRKVFQKDNNLNGSNQIVQRRYNRIAAIYDMFEFPMEKMAMGSWRRKLISRVRGPDVLEVGVGTGKNLPLYPECLSITAVDISPKMLVRSMNKPYASKVKRMVMDVECLSFPDNSFDTVVASFLFCSVANPIKALEEINRVVKPEGQVLLLEHVRPGNRLLGKTFDILNPLVVRLMGPNINRDTVGNVLLSGLHIEEEMNLFSDIMKLMVCRKGNI